MRCAVHGLATGPDGRCTICMRGERAASYRSSKRLGWACLLALTGAGAALLLVNRHQGAPTAQPEHVIPVADTVERGEPPEHTELSSASPATTSYIGASKAQPRAAAAAQVASNEATAAAPAPTAARAAPSRAELERAVHDTPIIMFSTSWCPVCRKAKAFLAANGLRYAERDIERDEAARRELKRRAGTSAIPTLEVDGELLTPGLDERAVFEAVTRSVERRLGVSGLSVRRN